MWIFKSVFDAARLGLPSLSFPSSFNFLSVFFTPYFSILYLSIVPNQTLPPPSCSPLILFSPASYHLGQATWLIGVYGNQLEADNN